MRTIHGNIRVIEVRSFNRVGAIGINTAFVHYGSAEHRHTHNRHTTNK